MKFLTWQCPGQLFVAQDFIPLNLLQVCGIKVYIKENGRTIKTIPYEGSLLTLFDSREELRSMLERTSKNMICAEISVKFVVDNGNQIGFSIKDSPYVPRQVDNDHVIVYDNGEIPSKFKGRLKLIKLDEPQKEAEEMSFDEGIDGYTLPEVVRSWGRTLLIGGTRGRIRPIMIDMTTEMDHNDRMNIREHTIVRIENDLQESSIGDGLWQRIIGWFYRSQEENISANSILELYCVARNYKSLLCLTFQLFAQCKNDEARATLMGQLKVFSEDLAFQWYWLQPHLSDIFAQLYSFIKDPTCPIMKDMYINWALAHEGEQLTKYICALNNKETFLTNMGQCLNDVLNGFVEWMQHLCISSMLQTYGTPSEDIESSLADNIIRNPKEIVETKPRDLGYITTNQEELNEETAMFFENFVEPNVWGNEEWLYPRVNAVAAHFRQKIDLFSKSDEIRRSIIYCCKSSNRHFIVSLNNKLVNYK